ncbi:hypothetical protein Q5P01_015766 [Channa striata]|uniref:Uncharacterized protein n=1 Tax=Channa striata TaxID=64152 RepID=A0AA88MFC6_CHASR|nr:hypothetical protein Q5P01_015766 [Channa striata]
MNPVTLTPQWSSLVFLVEEVESPHSPAPPPPCSAAEDRGQTHSGNFCKRDTVRATENSINPPLHLSPWEIHLGLFHFYEDLSRTHHHSLTDPAEAAMSV